MGGEAGNRGYLVQTIIALLESLGDDMWEYVRIEPDESSQKVDILWEGRAGKKAVQVKSSINQIGKAEAERWAAELRSGAAADSYALVLVGPSAQSVVEMGSYQGVSIPCPKSLDIEGLLHEAAHKLDKFLEAEGLDRRSAIQREVMVNALTTRLSVSSTYAKSLSRIEFIALLKSWISAISGPVGSLWEQVSFERQRGIENAVAGQRLGPSDVNACPEFAICEEIVAELSRSHLYEVVGTPGCGKSITGWHVARRFHKAGFSVWRPRAFANPEELIASIPRSERTFLVVDDAHQYGRPFAIRMSECSASDTKVLLISTVQDALLSSIICISPGRCVEHLANTILNRRDELLPIIRKYDDRVGNSYNDTSYEVRVQQARKESKPWEFFWVLRGGWQTARREFESVKQFAHAADVLLLIAVGQIASCDAGVPYEWILQHAQRAGIVNSRLETAMGHLHELRLVLQHDSIRTKHITYAYRIVEESFHHSNFRAWPGYSALFLDCILANGWSLKGVAWALDAIRRLDAFRWNAHASFQGLVEPLTQRCLQERDDVDWAAGCLSRLFSSFEVATEEILRHGPLLLDWATSRSGLVSYFCSDIINELINRSNRASDNLARQFIDGIDVARLADVANAVGVDDLHTFGKLLDRLAFYRPTWAAQFIERFDWGRVKEVILNAHADRAFAVDDFVTAITLLARPENNHGNLRYVEETVPYTSKAINADPCDAIDSSSQLGSAVGVEGR